MSDQEPVEIAVAPNYDDGCVWVEIPPLDRTCVEPDLARKMADDMESEANRMAAGVNGQEYEHQELIRDLRRFADQVESDPGGGTEGQA